MRHDEQSAVPAADSNKAQPRPEPTRNSEPKLPFASESKRRRELLRFAKVWAPYGGAPHEEIFVAYGLRPDQFYAQLATNRRANTGDSASRSNARSFVAAVGQTALGLDDARGCTSGHRGRT